MNDAQLILSMKQILAELEKLTRSSQNINYMQIRKLCMDLQDDANSLWGWAMDAEDEMDIADWRQMREKFRGKA
jgi:hypothetical protein